MRLRQFSLLPALLLIGCGGSGHRSGSNASVNDRVGPQVAIAWPARARDFVAPPYAGAVRVLFPNSGANNANLAQVVARPAGTAAVTQSLLLNFAVSPGVHLVRVEFLADADGGVPLATASLNANVQGDGTLRNLDVSPLGAVFYASRITGLTVAAAQNLEVGATADPLVTAQTEGGVVALRPGAVSFAVASGGGSLAVAPNGALLALAPGTATVVATAEGVASAPAILTVLPAPVAARVVSLATSAFVADPTRGLLWVATPDGFVRSVDPAAGTLGAPIAVGADPTVLALSDDGTTLYAGLRSAGLVRKVDLVANLAGPGYAVPNSLLGGAGYAPDVAVQPGHPNTLALSVQEFNSVANDGPIVLDDGVPRPKALGLDKGTRLLWTAADRIVAYNPDVPTDVLHGASVDATGATLVQSVPSGLNGFRTRLVLAGGRLYDRSGVVFDAATLARVGAFSLGLTDFFDLPFGPAVDPAARRAYFVVLSGGELRLLAFDTDTFAPTGARRVAGVPNPTAAAERPNLVKLGLRLALRLPDRLVFLDDLTGL